MRLRAEVSEFFFTIKTKFNFRWGEAVCVCGGGGLQ